MLSIQPPGPSAANPLGLSLAPSPPAPPWSKQPISSSHSSSPRGTAWSSDENITGEGGAWNCTLNLRRFLLPLRHEGGALEAWVPAESESGGSDSRSGQVGAETIGSWGVAVGSSR